MHRFEADYFEQHASYAERGGYAAMLADVRRFYGQYFRIGSRAAPQIAHGEGKRALEVGCALGAGVELLRTWRYEVFGTDISTYAIGEARRRYGDDMHFAVSDAQLNNPFGLQFRLVVAIHVLEHLLDIGAAMSALACGIEAGGYLLVATPNPGSLSPYRRFQRDPTHISEQRPHVWKALAEGVGLRVIACKTFHIVPVLHRWLGVRYLSVPGWLGYDTVIVAQKNL
ncbi:MAG: class I SAM-dependent methyltransferase [Candidatus Eremiobacteraeota bacterium]|nr:class I SAM-dependent methyltransferase [Candidatus Eremiobacteraeota bacterium]